MMQGTQTSALLKPKGVGWGGRWEIVARGRGHIYTYLRLIHVDVCRRNQHDIVKQLTSN